VRKDALAAGAMASKATSAADDVGRDDEVAPDAGGDITPERDRPTRLN
jgi:hypothetical protein